jgi:hypothetical protein
VAVVVVRWFKEFDVNSVMFGDLCIILNFHDRLEFARKKDMDVECLSLHAETYQMLFI